MESRLSSCSEDDADIPLSALQHWLFCPRQCGLIHIDRLWAENAATMQGRLLHERPDGGRHETRPGVRVLRALPLRSARLGVFGVADVVEMLPEGPFPVEYKRGAPKAHRADEVQLCAQAMALEEMFGADIVSGALFYGKTRRRKAITFDAGLRSLTAQVAAEAAAALRAGAAPPPVYDARRCDACSLRHLCHPQTLATPVQVADWLAAGIESEGDAL